MWAFSVGACLAPFLFSKNHFKNFCKEPTGGKGSGRYIFAPSDTFPLLQNVQQQTQMNISSECKISSWAMAGCPQVGKARFLGTVKSLTLSVSSPANAMRGYLEGHRWLHRPIGTHACRWRRSLWHIFGASFTSRQEWHRVHLMGQLQMIGSVWSTEVMRAPLDGDRLVLSSGDRERRCVIQVAHWATICIGWMCWYDRGPEEQWLKQGRSVLLFLRKAWATGGPVAVSPATPSPASLPGPLLLGPITGMLMRNYVMPLKGVCLG